MVREFIERIVWQVRPGAGSISRSGLRVTIGWYMRKGAGPLVRGAVWRGGFGSCDGPCLVGARLRVMYPRYMKLGSWVSIGGGGVINALSRQGIRLGDRVTIREGCWIQCASSPTDPGEGLVIGPRTYIGPGSVIGSGGLIEIGADCQIGAGVTVIAENHEMDERGGVSGTAVQRVGIRIGDGSWLGHRVVILDGVQLGDGCVVGAGAVVTRSFPAGSRIGGVPARVLREDAS